MNTAPTGGKMAITVLKKRQKKALAIAFLTLAFVGLIIPTAVHYTIDFIKSFTKEVVVWKITNETDMLVSFQFFIVITQCSFPS